MDPEYQRTLEAFVRTGAELIQTSIPERYPRGVPWNGVRPLEPGFIPPDGAAKVTAISWYPNDGDLGGQTGYDALREHFAHWGRDGTVEAYRVAYNDWLGSLPHIRFYRTHTLPVLEALGLTARDIAWIPLIKVPMRPKAKPSDDVVLIDREDTWKQIRLLWPRVAWVQGVTTTAKWIGALLRDQIDAAVVEQDINERRTTEERQAIIDGVVARLRRSLSKT